MDLRRWITAEHDAVLTRFEQSVASAVPLERWTDAVGVGGSSIAWLAFHTSYHADLAVNAVLRQDQPLLTAWRDRLGLGTVPAAVGLGEAEQPELTTALDLDHLVPYVRAVHGGAAQWLAAADVELLETPAAGPEGLARSGIDEADVPWLYTMWSAKPASWFVQWEAIGHRVNHLGEMVSVRNRLGLSPF
ncbi:MAG: hypothetical protein ABW195_14140 [Ilumatobacteraceae bacterium]